MSNADFMNTDDVLELLGEYGNPNINRTRNRDSASAVHPDRDPNGVHWSLFIRVFGLCRDAGGQSVNLNAGSTVSAKDAALKAFKQLDDLIESGEFKTMRENYIKYFVRQTKRYRERANVGRRWNPDNGPTSEPEWEPIKNDPCTRPTEEELQP